MSTSIGLVFLLNRAPLMKSDSPIEIIEIAGSKQYPEQEIN
jgi:hypothetical protein